MIFNFKSDFIVPMSKDLGTASNRSGATSSLVRQKMAMFEKMAAKGSSSNGEEEEELPRPPKLGNLVKSRHEWIMKQQSKGYSSPDPLVPSVAKASDSTSNGSECRNDHVKLVTKNVHNGSDDERDGASNEVASSWDPDPIFLGSAEEPTAVEMVAAAPEAPVPEICFGGRAEDNADDSSAVHPMDVSVLGGFEAVEEEAAPAAVACLVKHNRSFTRVTVIGSSSSRGNTPVMMNQQESAAASAAGSSSKSSAAPTAATSEELAPMTTTTPPTIREALFEDNEPEVEEGKECDSMINEFDLVRVDSTYHGATSSPIKWCSETLLITEDEWEAVPKIDKDAVWRETKKPFKWCLDTLMIENTL